MKHRLPDNLGLAITALSFGRTPVNEAIPMDEITKNVKVQDLFKAIPPQNIEADGKPKIHLAALSGTLLLIK